MKSNALKKSAKYVDTTDEVIKIIKDLVLCFEHYKEKSNIMEKKDDIYELTPEEAKEITVVTFTVEELENYKTVWLIRMMKLHKSMIDAKQTIIDLLHKKLEFYEPEPEKKDQSKSKTQIRNPFLRVV